MTDRIDSFRFVDFLTRKILKNWMEGEPRRDIPWTPLEKPLAECTVAAVSSGAVGEMKAPGTVVHLPFRWPQSPEETKWHPAEPSPIIALMTKRRPASGS